MSTPRDLLDRLETRHDELLRKLDELNAQIERALADFAHKPAAAAAAEAAVIHPAESRRAA